MVAVGRLCKEVIGTAGIQERDDGDGGSANDTNDGDSGGGERIRGGGSCERESGLWPRATEGEEKMPNRTPSSVPSLLPFYANNVGPLPPQFPQDCK